MRMPKGITSKTLDRGMTFWFECECGHRWEGGSQRAKSMAHRLHSKVCNTSQLSNPELHPIALWKDSKAAAIDTCVDVMKAGHVREAEPRKDM